MCFPTQVHSHKPVSKHTHTHEKRKGVYYLWDVDLVALWPSIGHGLEVVVGGERALSTSTCSVSSVVQKLVHLQKISHYYLGISRVFLYNCPFTCTRCCTWFELHFAADLFTGWLVWVCVCVLGAETGRERDKRKVARLCVCWVGEGCVCACVRMCWCSGGGRIEYVMFLICCASWTVKLLIDMNTRWASHLQISPKSFTVATVVLFSASKQTHCTLVACDSEWVTVAFTQHALYIDQSGYNAV